METASRDHDAARRKNLLLILRAYNNENKMRVISQGGLHYSLFEHTPELGLKELGNPSYSHFLRPVAHPPLLHGRPPAFFSSVGSPNFLSDPFNLESVFALHRKQESPHQQTQATKHKEKDPMKKALLVAQLRDF